MMNTVDHTMGLPKVSHTIHLHLPALFTINGVVLNRVHCRISLLIFIVTNMVLILCRVELQVQAQLSS